MNLLLVAIVVLVYGIDTIGINTVSVGTMTDPMSDTVPLAEFQKLERHFAALQILISNQYWAWPLNPLNHFDDGWQPPLNPINDADQHEGLDGFLTPSQDPMPLWMGPFDQPQGDMVPLPQDSICQQR